MISLKKNKTVAFTNSNEANRDKYRSRKLLFFKLKNNLLKWVPIFLLFAGSGNWVLGLILAAAYYCIYVIFFDRSDIYIFKPTISIWFGVPGSGKTSMAALLTKASLKMGYKVLSNVNIKGAYVLEPEDLGKYDMSFGGDGCHVVYDEGSIDFDNMNHKAFVSSDKPRYFALHRHMHNRVDVFSQGYDIDKRIRDRAGSSGLFHLRRFPLPGFVMYRHIKKVLFIKKEDKQMVDGFEFQGLPRIVYSRSVWDSFDTLDDSLCPKLQKEWVKW